MRKSWLVFPFALALAWPAPRVGVAQTTECPPSTLTPTFCVELGSDYFQTQPGTMFNFGAPIGIVDLIGKPIGPGLTDTIIQRQADAVINGGPAPIMITNLSLQGTAPVNIGGSFFDVFVTLDPAHLAQDTGTIAIMGTTAGGTFNSTLDVFFEAQFTPLGGGPPIDIFNNLTLSQTGAAWGPTPAPGDVIVTGNDTLPSEQLANLHTVLDPNEVDFFVTPPLIEQEAGLGQHVVDPAPVPEPGTLILFSTGILGLAILRRRTVKSEGR